MKAKAQTAKARERKRKEEGKGIPSAFTTACPMPRLAPVTNAAFPLKEEPIKRCMS